MEGVQPAAAAASTTRLAAPSRERRLPPSPSTMYSALTAAESTPPRPDSCCLTDTAFTQPLRSLTLRRMAAATLEPTEVVADPPDDSSHGRSWWYIVGTIIVVSAIVHLWKLGLRPLAHDEAIDARFSWQARNFGVMEYDPVYHGPLRFYIEGVVLRFFGTGPGWARLVAALAGIASTALIATSHRTLGRIGAPVAALLFAISPTVLTVTRTGREDSLTGLVSLAMLLIVADALRTRPTQRHAIATGALLATSFTLKETTFIFGFAAACFLVGLGVFAWRRDGQARRFLTTVAGLGRTTWLWTAVAFLAVFMLVFTSAFRYAAGFESGLLDGIRYWLSQHDVRRGSQRWFFYLTILGAYEWLTLALATVGTVVAVKTKSMVGLWFATMALVQLAVYSWAGEKFAWLALHPMIPLVLLAGLGAEHLARRSMAASADSPDDSPDNSPNNSKVSPVLVGAIAIAMLGTAALAIRPAITAGHDPRELLVTVQTGQRVPELTDELRAAQASGTVNSILVDERDSGSWPWAWYLNDFRNVGYLTIDPAQPLPEGYDVYIVSASTDPPPVPDGFTIERFALRSWWLPDYGNMSVGDAATWFATRETWNPTGSSDQYVIRRPQAG